MKKLQGILCVLAIPALFVARIRQSNSGLPDKKSRDVAQFHRIEPGRDKGVCNILRHE